MGMEKAFAGGEITNIVLLDGTHYNQAQFELGVVQSSTLFAAIDRKDVRQVSLIPYHAVQVIEVEYGNNKSASEGKDASGTRDPAA